MHTYIKQTLENIHEYHLCSPFRMGNRTLIEPTQLFELFKEKEEYRQQCLALEQRLKDKEEFIQQLKA